MPSRSADSGASRDRCFSLLADCLGERRNAITKIWIDGVRRHPGIPSARGLTFQQLSDHLPKLFDDLAESLRAVSLDESPPVAQISDDARKHGLHRWEQGFKLDELLRELSMIRSLILRDGLDWFLEAHPECASTITAAREAIVRFFEETNIGSVEQYIREQQDQLETLNGELRRVDSARLRLMGTVAHELGNSVYSLKMIIAALSAVGPTGEEDRRRALALSEGAFGEIQTFLSQLTDYAALLSHPQMQWEAVDLPALCQDLHGAYAGTAAEAGLRFSVVAEEGFQSARTDRLKLKRIASNLITNAIKFRQPEKLDGEVKVTIAPAVDGETWTLSVEDDGIGIAPGDATRIFEEFTRLATPKEIPGVGLGLSITRSLVGLLQGSIRVEERAAGGSRFIVKLPLTPSI